MLQRTLVFFLVVLFSVQGHCNASKSEEGDPLSLAALMIKDQHYLRAQGILEDADTSKKDFDFKRYHTLSGITALNIEQYGKAVEHLQKAIELGVDDPLLYVYLSQASFRMEDYPAVIQYVDQAPTMKAKYPSLMFMKYEAYRNMNKPFLAWDALKEGQQLFPENEKFIKQQVFTLIQLGFYQQAAELGLQYTRQYQPQADSYIAIGTALSRSQNSELAAQFLESARLQYPASTRANKALANYYSSQKKYYVASRIMESLAIQDPSLMTEAAELNKLSRQYFRTLFLNSRSTSQKDKLKQRLALFLQFEEYEKASLMQQDLQRNKVLEDDNVRYALAYSHFKVGKFDQAEVQLNQIRSSRLLNKANQIRLAMIECRQEKWKCQ